MDAGIPKASSNSSSHARFFMSKSIVLAAFDTSVAWTLPLVRFHKRHVSTVPKSNSPLSALSLAPSTLSSIHFILVPEKYASTTRPVFSRIICPYPAPTSSSHIDAVRLHCQTIALCTGFPLLLSQTTVVSLWFVIPMASISSQPIPAVSIASLATPLWLPHISIGSCSTQPGLG